MTIFPRSRTSPRGHVVRPGLLHFTFRPVAVAAHREADPAAMFGTHRAPAVHVPRLDLAEQLVELARTNTALRAQLKVLGTECKRLKLRVAELESAAADGDTIVCAPTWSDAT